MSNEESFYPPDWEYWRYIPAVSIKDVCFLAINLECNAFEATFLQYYEERDSRSTLRDDYILKKIQEKTGFTQRDLQIYGDGELRRAYTNLSESELTLLMKDAFNSPELVDLQESLESYESWENGPKKTLESDYEALYEVVTKNLSINHGSIIVLDQDDDGEYLISFENFSEWALSVNLDLPDEFPRGNVKKPDTANELKQTYRVIAELLDSVVGSQGSTIKQSAISSEIANRKIPGLGKRLVDDVFAKARKVQKE